MNTNGSKRFRLVYEVYDPKAYAEHLGAQNRIDEAWDVLDEGPGESDGASFDDEAAARTAAAETPPPGVRYHVRPRRRGQS